MSVQTRIGSFDLIHDIIERYRGTFDFDLVRRLDIDWQEVVPALDLHPMPGEKTTSSPACIRSTKMFNARSVSTAAK